MHTCPICKHEKPVSEYYFDKRRGFPMWGCKPCRMEYYASPEHKAKKKARKERQAERDPDFYRRGTLRRYNMTPEQYDELLSAQGGGCGACGAPPKGQALHVDHDHACCPGKRSCGRCVRGLLCYPCNRFLGIIKDDPGKLIAHLSRRPFQ